MPEPPKTIDELMQVRHILCPGCQRSYRDDTVYCHYCRYSFVFSVFDADLLREFEAFRLKRREEEKSTSTCLPAQISPE